MYYFPRTNDPYLARFAQADTIVPGGVQGYDRYAYVNNSPMRYTDPSGHSVECSGGLGGCVYSKTSPGLNGRKERGDEDDTSTCIVCFTGNGKKNTSTDLEESGPITGLILQLPGSTEDWSNLATGLDVLAWLTDIYAASAVTYAGFAGAALPAPLVTAGLPEVPLVTGLAGMAIAELYVQPVLFTGNALASFSMGATIISDTKAGNTRIEDSKYSISVLNSMALTDVGWMSNEAYLSLTIQSVSVANDLGWTSLPFPTIP